VVRGGLYPDSLVRFQESILQPGPGRDAGSGWWIVDAEPRSSPRAVGERRIVFDHVTAVGSGLARVGKTAETLPLRFEVSDTIFCGSALLRWESPTTFPTGLVWGGSGNLYDLTGPAWVVGDEAAGTAIPDAPTGLESWTGQMTLSESESRAGDARFALEPAGSGREPGDYVLTSLDSSHPGAHPAQVATPPGR
jgi:hypothetical protein